MSTLHQRRLGPGELAHVIEEKVDGTVALSDEHRASLASRFRAVGGLGRRRLDAWSVERAGAPTTPFRWTPRGAKRAIGRGALRRLRAGHASTVTAAVADEIDELHVRAAAGYARAGSLSHWIANQSSAVVALAAAEAISWATSTLEIIDPVACSWTVYDADAYYDVASAQTSLRGCRDVMVTTGAGRVVLRVRSGQPGRSAGPGLRADLVMDGLCDVEGRLAQRMIGLWPDAGIALAVDGTIDNARAGARDLVRTAVAQRRASRALAA